MESFMVETKVEQYLGEIIVGIVILVFGLAFTNWANTIKSSTSTIIEKLERLALDFHDHTIKTEGRVTRVETQIEEWRKKMDLK